MFSRLPTKRKTNSLCFDAIDATFSRFFRRRSSTCHSCSADATGIAYMCCARRVAYERVIVGMQAYSVCCCNNVSDCSTSEALGVLPKRWHPNEQQHHHRSLHATPHYPHRCMAAHACIAALEPTPCASDRDTLHGTGKVHDASTRRTTKARETQTYGRPLLMVATKTLHADSHTSFGYFLYTGRDPGGIPSELKLLRVPILLGFFACACCLFLAVASDAAVRHT